MASLWKINWLIRMAPKKDLKRKLKRKRIFNNNKSISISVSDIKVPSKLAKIAREKGYTSELHEELCEYFKRILKSNAEKSDQEDEANQREDGDKKNDEEAHDSEDSDSDLSLHALVVIILNVKTDHNLVIINLVLE